MSNVSTPNNILLNDEMSKKSLDFGPIPLPRPQVDAAYFDLTSGPQSVVDEAQTVDVKVQNVSVVTESAAPTKIVTAESKNTAAQKMCLGTICHHGTKTM